VRAAQRDASSKCLAELAEIGPLEFAEDYGTDETGSDALEQCMDETAELALDPGDDYSQEDERSRGASQDLSQPFHDSCRRCHKWLIRLVVVENSFRLEAPRPSTHPVDVGLRTEAAILAELVRRGYQVLVPFGTNQRYDLVLDLDGRFVRAQCKTGRLRRGVVVFNTTSVRSNRRGWFIRGYEGEAEIFLVYCADTDRIYAVPVEDAPAGSGCLRVDPARNGQVDGIRWARDYELPA
jgi:hypothetical protein